MKRRHAAPGTPALLLAGSLLSQLVLADPLPNAWQITDDSSSSASGGNYQITLLTHEQDAALAEGWHYSVNARLVSDFGGSMTMLFYYGVGTNRFSVFWDLDSNGDLTAKPFNQPAVVLTTNGAGRALYHTHEIIYNPTNSQASYYFDGVLKATWAGDGVTADNGLVVWGSGSTSGMGQMNFHSAKFFVGTNSVPSASYDAGTEGNPPVAPLPEDQLWMPFLAPGATVIPISPDTALLPATLTSPATQLTTNSARLNGQAYSGGSPTMAWFQWGTDTNYGYTTAMQDVGQDLGGSNVSAVVTGVFGGQDYHFRLAASNTFGIAVGMDQIFALPSFFPVSIPGFPSLSLGFPVWGDYDNDGRLDLLITGTTNGSSGIVQIWRNAPSGFSNVTASVAPGLADGNYSSAAWGDYDNDNRLDFLLTQATSNSVVAELWRNTGNGFSKALSMPGAVWGSVTWGDYDNDGRLDFLLTGIANVFAPISQIWRNTGNGFTNIPVPGLPGVYYSSAAWGDFDADGRLDFLLTGTTNGDPSGIIAQLWRNTGDGFTNVPISGLLGVYGYGTSAFALADYDNDGRLDFFITGPRSNSAVAQIWRNTTTGFSNVTESVAPGLTALSAVSAAWGDYDNDGWPDFLLTGQSTNYTMVQLWRNTGSGFANASASLGSQSLDSTSGAAWGDYDNDGRLDFVAAPFTSGSLQLWRNYLPVSNAPPSAPTGLSATVSADTLALNWNAPGDDYTPADGLNYNVRIGTTPGGSNIVSGSSLGNGRRLVPQLGNAGPNTNAFYQVTPGWTYYWSVQAIDSSYAGSPFAAEQPIFVPSVLSHLRRFENGVFQFEFGADPSVIVEIRGTTNLALPVTSWDYLGLPIPLGGGLYQFNDSLAPNYPQRFYLLRKQ